MRFFAAIGCVAMSWPQTIAVPAVGARKPVIIFIVVDLPAPFGPRKPSTSPRGTVKEMSSTALSAPKYLARCRISSIARCPPIARFRITHGHARLPRCPGRAGVVVGALPPVQIAEILYQHDGRFVPVPTPPTPRTAPG